ncbi:6949_t:CDS:2, partial [Dentiscutata heterogama]
MEESKLSQFSESPSIYSSIKIILKSSNVNLLLNIVPFGIVSKFAIWSDTSIFFLNFLAIIPLTWLLYYVTREISLSVASPVEWWLCNVFGNFGNLAEFITYTLMLYDGLVSVVQAGKTYMSFLILMVFVITIPTAYSSTIVDSDHQTELDTNLGLAESWNISTKFVGLILIPNFGNASDYLNSITHTRENAKLDL